MPTFVPEETDAGPVLQGFSGGGFKVDGVVHRAVLLTPATVTAWQPGELDALTVDALAPLLDPKPELILLGTGAALRRPPAARVAALDAQGVGIEAMDSRAAARAWLILRTENRLAAAALLPIG